MFLGLRTVIYPTADLTASTTWFTRLLGFGPYFEQPFYVGFSVAGYELGLDPQADLTVGPITYWGVANADAGLAHLLYLGASLRTPVTEVGDGIKVVTALEPGGTIIGLIENPHFALPAAGT